jgi:hypothetical protein
MYRFVIQSNDGREFEGVASDRGDLDYLINKKVSSSAIKGSVDIYSGKKIIESYQV